MTHNPCDPEAQSRRQAYINALYNLSGRSSPDHPHHATFTGLITQRLRDLLERDMELLLHDAADPST